MDEATRIAIENYRNLNDNPRRGFNVRVNGEEHSASSRNGQATIHFPMDGQLMYISELAMKVIINDGYIPGGGGNNDSACDNWSYGSNSYPTLKDWLVRYPVGSKVDVDCAYACQCWDYASAFWRAQTGRNLQTQQGGNGVAWQCWEVSRYVNAGTEFDLIYEWKNIKAGDWVVWGTNGTGHIAMAMENCPPQGTMATILFRQQDGVTPQRGVFDSRLPFEGLANDNHFIGAFRYKPWHP